MNVELNLAVRGILPEVDVGQPIKRGNKPFYFNDGTAFFEAYTTPNRNDSYRKIIIVERPDEVFPNYNITDIELRIREKVSVRMPYEGLYTQVKFFAHGKDPKDKFRINFRIVQDEVTQKSTLHSLFMFSWKENKALALRFKIIDGEGKLLLDLQGPYSSFTEEDAACQRMLDIAEKAQQATSKYIALLNYHIFSPTSDKDR